MQMVIFFISSIYKYRPQFGIYLHMLFVFFLYGSDGQSLLYLILNMPATPCSLCSKKRIYFNLFIAS